MRISCIKDDKGTHVLNFTGKIYLDGVEYDKVITADEEEGFIVLYKRDKRGNAMLSPDRAHAETETLYGKVKIEGLYKHFCISKGLYMKLPQKIKVACFDIEIREWDAKTANVRGCFGEYSGDECIIRIDATHNGQRVVETLIHEITHAIYHLYGISDEDKEERIVTAISRGWHQVYRDNPDVLQLIHSHAKAA